MATFLEFLNAKHLAVSVKHVQRNIDPKKPHRRDSVNQIELTIIDTRDNRACNLVRKFIKPDALNTTEEGGLAIWRVKIAGGEKVCDCEERAWDNMYASIYETRESLEERESTLCMELMTSDINCPVVIDRTLVTEIVRQIVPETTEGI